MRSLIQFIHLVLYLEVKLSAVVVHAAAVPEAEHVPEASTRTPDVGHTFYWFIGLLITVKIIPTINKIIKITLIEMISTNQNSPNKDIKGFSSTSIKI